MANLFGPPPGQNGQGNESEAWMHTHLRDQTTTGSKSPLAWWYRLTAPPEPPASASLKVREGVRRGLLASTLLFYLLLLLTLSLPVDIISSNHLLRIVVPVIIVMTIIALAFNRRGHPNITGLIIVVVFEGVLAGVIATNAGGLDPSTLGLFDILVFVEVFAASLLPINWVIVAALVNIAFCVFELATQAPHGDALMVQVMHQSGPLVILRPVLLHVIVSVVLWLWVRSATRAIERADRAEVIATLEHSIAEQEHHVADEKRLMDASIQNILQTHMRVSTGDFNARVPLVEGEPLWAIAGSLNNLLSRLQRLHLVDSENQRLTSRLQRAAQLEYELQHLKGEIQYSLKAVALAEAEQRKVFMRRSGTMLDALVVRLHGKYLVQSQEGVGQKRSTGILPETDEQKSTGRLSENGQKPPSSKLSETGQKPPTGQKSSTDHLRAFEQKTSQHPYVRMNLKTNR